MGKITDLVGAIIVLIIGLYIFGKLGLTAGGVYSLFRSFFSSSPSPGMVGMLGLTSASKMRSKKISRKEMILRERKASFLIHMIPRHNRVKLLIPLFMVFVLAFLAIMPGHATSSSREITASPSSSQPIYQVVLSSSLPGQPQFLTVPQNVSGSLLYPDISISLISSSTVPYQVYLNGKSQANGTVQGVHVINLTIPNGTSQASISVILGSTTWNYPHELISSISIAKYYGPKGPVAQYTLFQIEMATLKGFVAAVFALAIAMFTGRKYILEKEKREAIFV